MRHSAEFEQAQIDLLVKQCSQQRMTWEEYKEKHKSQLEDRMGNLPDTNLHVLASSIQFPETQQTRQRRQNQETNQHVHSSTAPTNLIACSSHTRNPFFRPLLCPHFTPQASLPSLPAPPSRTFSFGKAWPPRALLTGGITAGVGLESDSREYRKMLDAERNAKVSLLLPHLLLLMLIHVLLHAPVCSPNFIPFCLYIILGGAEGGISRICASLACAPVPLLVISCFRTRLTHTSEYTCSSGQHKQKRMGSVLAWTC